MIKPATPVSPRMVEVAPNRFRQLELGFELPEAILCDLVPNGDNTFRLVPRSWERLVRVTIPLCAKLGLSRVTIIKLIRSGFVDGARMVPKGYVLNLNSYFAHMKRCAEDPDFWEDARRRETYNTAY